MFPRPTEYIPSITSPAGLSLTAANWKEVGVETVSCGLYELLFKPGIEVLYQIENLKKYLGWDGSLILNASGLPNHNKGHYKLKNPYDGNLIHFDTADLVKLISHLQPDALVLPPNFMTANPEIWVHNTIQNIANLENDEPATFGYEGKVYTDSGVIDLQDPRYRMEFKPIQESCGCPTCKQDFTRAYLHHLYFATANLCQRYLIQHNAWTKIHLP